MSAYRRSGGAGSPNKRTSAGPALFAVALSLVIASCSAGSDGESDQTSAGPVGSTETLYIGGIPDQELSILEERFDGVAAYLESTVGITVEYVPSTDYAALVTAFGNGDIKLGWFGGLTGVQARLAKPGAEAIAQRPIDQEFVSVFIVGKDFVGSDLTDLRSATFTFGSESSTSGHLMPRYFLTEAGIDPESDFEGAPGYSGSHDATWQLIASGAYEAGALNVSVWERAVEDGLVDTAEVRELTRTDPYFDYHWVIHPDVDTVWGAGTTTAIEEALLAMGEDEASAAVLELFDAESFIPTSNENYAAIEDVAASLGLIGE